MSHMQYIIWGDIPKVTLKTTQQEALFLQQQCQQPEAPNPTDDYDVE